MARKPVLGPPPKHPELDALMERTGAITVTEEQLREQRISFAYGNAPRESGISKESVRRAAGRLCL